MNFLSELKNRVLLLTNFWFYLVFICYYYKKMLFFLIFNTLILKNKTDFYFLTMNITELFWVYWKLITFFSNQLLYHFLIYHLLLFIGSALYKNELTILKKLFCFLVINLQITFNITLNLLFPILWQFFENFQKLALLGLIYMELRMTDCLSFFFETYFLFQSYMTLAIITTYFLHQLFYNKFVLKKFRKIFYFLCFVSFALIDSTNQFFILALFVSFYETSVVIYFFFTNVDTIIR